jgi:putative ABC transport system substrate-binding protein
MMNRRAATHFPGAARHEVTRCRPGIVTNAESGTVPDQRRTISWCTASGTRPLRRRDFITLVGGVAAGWPLAASAQRQPVIGFLNSGSLEAAGERTAAFRKGLGESGYIEGQNVNVEYHWLEGQSERLPSVAADLVRRRVAVIAAAGNAEALAAKAATATIPIAFQVAEDPVRLGLVASLARPGGNATGVNFFSAEIPSKRLSLLHELVPKAARIWALANPGTGSTETVLRELSGAARALGLQIEALKAGTGSEIEAAFATLARERAEALYVLPGAFFASRRVQLATLAARHAIPASLETRDMVEAGGLMSYGTDILDVYRQTGSYVGQILKGAKPADLPVLQSTKFEFAINLQTARAIGIEVPANLIAIADHVIE